VESTQTLANSLIDQERRARDDLLKNERLVVEDRIGRAVAVLSSAKILGTREAMELLSSIRLGIYYGMVPGIKTDALDALVIRIQPAHLQKRFPHHLEPLDRDVERAKLVRETLKYAEG
jgi:protein arginine kinase